MATEAVKGLFNLFGGAINTAMTTPEGLKLLNDSIKSSHKKDEE